MFNHKRAILALVMILALTFMVVGCGSSTPDTGATDPNQPYTTALSTIDFSDGDTPGLSSESVFTASGIPTYNGIYWNSCYFDNIKTTASLVSIQNNQTTAIGNVNFTVTGNYHVNIKDSISSITTQIDQPFSVSGSGVVNFIKTNNVWQVDSFSSQPLVTDTYSPVISNFSISPTTVKQGDSFTANASVVCSSSLPVTEQHVLLFIATRNYGIDWDNCPPSRRFITINTSNSSYSSGLLPTRNPIKLGAHFGGLYVCELVKTSSSGTPTYNIHFTLYPSMIKITQ